MWITIAVTVVALGLFVHNRLRVELVGLLVMASLVVTQVITPEEGIAGFANEAVVTVAAMLVLSTGLVRTGAIDALGRLLRRAAGQSELKLLLLSVALVIPLSAFVNNTPVVAVMVPLVIGLARKIGAQPSKLLMPISFASQMGGTLTLIGTSTNLLVAGLVLELGLPRIRVFDITPAAGVLAVIGVVYLLTLGRWLTPVREGSGGVLEAYELREYLTVLIVQPESNLVGSTLLEARFAEKYGLEVIALERDGHRRIDGVESVPLEAGDVLISQGRVDNIVQLADSAHLRVAEPNLERHSRDIAFQVDPEQELAELLVTPRSRAIGQTLQGLKFRQRYGVMVLGIQRHGVSLMQRMRKVNLQPGDLLLVRATPADLTHLHQHEPDFALLGAMDAPVRRQRKLWLAVGILAAVVLLAAFGVMPILVSALLGVIAMFLTGCLTPDEAYQDMDWMVLVLLGTIIPLGTAIQKTGTAALVGDGLAGLTVHLGPALTLGAFYLLTSLMTELITNNAAAVVLTPVAVAVASSLGVSPMPFVIAVMLAASNSFMTPIGYQTNTFIYRPGGYRFSDFLRVGTPLNVIMTVASMLVIPLFFPF